MITSTNLVVQNAIVASNGLGFKNGDEVSYKGESAIFLHSISNGDTVSSGKCWIKLKSGREVVVDIAELKKITKLKLSGTDITEGTKVVFTSGEDSGLVGVVEDVYAGGRYCSVRDRNGYLTAKVTRSDIKKI